MSPAGPGAESKIGRGARRLNGGKGDGPAVNWVKVHRVPDYAYFNHAVHVNRGVSCYSCHGPVNDMRVVFQHESQRHEMVPRLPPRTGKPSPAAGPGFQPGVETGLQPGTASIWERNLRRSGTSTRRLLQAATDEARFPSSAEA